MASISFTDSLDSGASTFNPGVGTITPAVASPTQVTPVVFALTPHASLTVSIPAPHSPPLARRALMDVSVIVETPAVVAGRGHIPAKGWGALAFAGSALAGPGHLRPFADPDPVWDGTEWTVAPPEVPAGTHFMRWTTKDLPDPATLGGKYLLGTRSALDSTAGLPSVCDNWPISPGSDAVTPWRSAYPFKPTVENHIHLGSDGSTVTQTAGVHFTPGKVAHMWGDFGTFLSQPFTMLLVAIATDYGPGSIYNCMFDAGDDPTTGLTAAQMATIYDGGFAGEIALSESFGYRNGLRATRLACEMFNDEIPITRKAIAPCAHLLKPRIYAMVVHGASSFLYLRDTQTRTVKPIGLLNNGAQRLWVMGRGNGILSPFWSSSMVVFEARAWDNYLSVEQLDAQYAQLSSTWKFSLYK